MGSADWSESGAGRSIGQRHARTHMGCFVSVAESALCHRAGVHGHLSPQWRAREASEQHRGGACIGTNHTYGVWYVCVYGIGATVCMCMLLSYVCEWCSRKHTHSSRFMYGHSSHIRCMCVGGTSASTLVLQVGVSYHQFPFQLGRLVLKLDEACIDIKYTYGACMCYRMHSSSSRGGLYSISVSIRPTQPSFIHS